MYTPPPPFRASRRRRLLSPAIVAAVFIAGLGAPAAASATDTSVAGSLLASGASSQAPVSPPNAVDADQDRVTLVPQGSVWRWHYAATAWDEGWNAPGFDDTSWRTGAAPLGWGPDARTRTTPEAGVSRRPLSIQFRKEFSIAEGQQVSDVQLWFRADDGAAISVNGTEIARVNLPSGRLSATTYATKAPNPRTAERLHKVSIPASVLQSGTNVIAASTHLNWRATPSVTFDAEVVASVVDEVVTPPESPEPPVVTPPETPGNEEPPAENPEVCGAQGFLAPSCGALWGAYTIKGDTLTTAITDLEGSVGREFDITLRYHDFSKSTHQGLFPDSHEQTLGQTRTLLFAWQARVASTNTDIRWAAIARGEWDEYIDSAADRVKAFGQPVMIAFDPEFDRFDKGTMAEYVAAYQRVHDRFAARGVSNVAWLWVSTGYLGAGNDAKIASAYPGEEYVDWVGFDPYNFYTCNGSGWTTFEKEIAAPHDFMVRNGWGHKPQILMEYGTEFDEADPARSAQFYRDIPSVLRNYPNVKALVRFDAGSGNPSCDMRIANGPGMLEAFGDAGLDSWVNTRQE